MENEKRLIDANAFRRRINAFVGTVRYKGVNNVPTGYETCNPTEYMRGYERGVMDTYAVAVNQPQVDAVEVVRCKDCKKWEYDENFSGWCAEWRRRTHGDHFCSYGERGA